MRLTIVQYAGDYRETAERLAAGGAETYQAQRLSVEFVAELARRLEGVTTITAVTANRYDEVLPSGVRAIGAGFGMEAVDPQALAALTAETRPDRLLLRTPLPALLDWSRREKIRTLVTLADSFNDRGLRSWLCHRLLARRLSHRHVEWVGNHGRNASRQLVAMGVPAAKVVPWDWPATRTPAEFEARRRNGAGTARLFYVGAVSAAKGVDDILHALALLRQEGRPATLAIAGGGETERVARLAGELRLGDAVTMLGLVPNAEVVARMREADLVVVASRHAYPEGLPLTIYEALCSRTPIVASDHPMFVGNLRDRESAAIFRAGDPADLARNIAAVLDDPDLYARLSENGAAAWARLQLPVTWPELVDRWLGDGEEDRAWLSGHSMASGRYELR